MADEAAPVALLGLSDVVARALSRWAGAGAQGRRFLVDAVRSQADLAVAAMDRALPDFAPQPHRIALSVRAKSPDGGSSFSVTHPLECDQLPYGERCEFDLALWRGRQLLPGELGVYDATLGETGAPVFTWVRALTGEDWHG